MHCFMSLTQHYAKDTSTSAAMLHDTPLLVRSSLTGHLGCFQFSILYNLMFEIFGLSFRHSPRRGITGSKNKNMQGHSVDHPKKVRSAHTCIQTQVHAQSSASVRGRNLRNSFPGHSAHHLVRTTGFSYPPPAQLSAAGPTDATGEHPVLND